jgi:hypothetical protein
MLPRNDPMKSTALGPRTVVPAMKCFIARHRQACMGVMKSIPFGPVRYRRDLGGKVERRPARVTIVTIQEGARWTHLGGRPRQCGERRAGCCQSRCVPMDAANIQVFRSDRRQQSQRHESRRPNTPYRSDSWSLSPSDIVSRLRVLVRILRAYCVAPIIGGAMIV